MSLTEVAELVRRETGVTPAVAQENALRAALRRAAPELDPGAFIRAGSDPVRGRDLVERLIDEVTVQETTFVRDRGQLDGILWRSLLQQHQAVGPVRDGDRDGAGSGDASERVGPGGGAGLLAAEI